MDNRSKTLFHLFLPSLVFGGMVLSNAAAQENPLGWFKRQSDLGNPKNVGSVLYDAEREEYEITGSGTNMWADRDECHFLWRQLEGDFILQARARFTSEGVDPHRKIGWMVRHDLGPDSAYASVALHGDGHTALQFRRRTASHTEEIKSSVSAPDVIQLQRKGNTYIMSVARSGEVFATEQITNLELGTDVYIGLFVCSHNPDVKETAKFDNVRVIIPAKDGFEPYSDYIGSTLEILNLETGHRTLTLHVDDSLQAPNWTRDGRALIFNRNGRLYRFDLRTRAAKQIDTDFATNNNNDHALSFDGQMLAISHHVPEEEHRSVIYVVPVTGGTPSQVTSDEVDSYLHGWSPDGSTLVFTGVRDGNTDIYTIPGEGGPETQLTADAGFNDGAEYTPDGQTIFFNSSRSGTMEIWRMNADGSDQRQVTDDRYNNWFPHVSPDGKWIVFLTYLPEVPADQHPFYQQVYLRMMPVEGGEAKVVAYVYGGQGTINVPSWAPDSRSLAFVSNTD